MPPFEIVQIIPAAPGWWVEHIEESRSFFSAVALWALVEDAEGKRSVIGVDPAWVHTGSHGIATGNGGMLIEIPDEPRGHGYAFSTDTDEMLKKPL
ncbi:hypothetical protein ACQPZQ_30715 [Pseudonocardia sp. CA-142604]|uniref:hypothetical protein n=1 Tax=Pseudonocardia sp. CA-142604 TaxID=3240024 RepID=UPI003D8D3D6D